MDQRKNLRSNSDKIVSLPTRIKKNTMETNGYRLLLPEGTLDYFTISDQYFGKFLPINKNKTIESVLAGSKLH